MGGTATAAAATNGTGMAHVVASATAPTRVSGETSSLAVEADTTMGTGPVLEEALRPGQQTSAGSVGETQVYAVGAPSVDYLTDLFLFSPALNVQRFFAQADEAVAGAATLELNYDNGDFSGAQHTYTASVSCSPAAGGALSLGLQNFSEYGFHLAPDVLHSIGLTVTEGANTILSDTFTSLTDAEAFFTNNMIGLGAVPGDGAQVPVALSMTASGSGGFVADLLVGSGSRRHVGGTSGDAPAVPEYRCFGGCRGDPQPGHERSAEKAM